MKILFTFIVTFALSAVAYAQNPSLSDTSDINAAQQSFYGPKFQQCQNELKSLSKLDSEAYRTNKADLEYNMGRATRYLLLRSTLSPDIQSVMDSVHQANIAKNCQKIHQSLYTALLKEAENG